MIILRQLKLLGKGLGMKIKIETLRILKPKGYEGESESLDIREKRIEIIDAYGEVYEYENVYEFIDYVSKNYDVKFKELSKEFLEICKSSRSANKTIRRLFAQTSEAITLGKSEPYSPNLKLFYPKMVFSISQSREGTLFERLVAVNSLRLFVEWVNNHILWYDIENKKRKEKIFCYKGQVIDIEENIKKLEELKKEKLGFISEMEKEIRK